MARVKMLDVLLDRKWSSHEAGEIVTVEDYTANSMVRKNYGRILTAAEKKKIEADKRPQVETATAPPPAETAVVNPNLRTKDKAVISAQTQGEDAEEKKDQSDKTDKDKNKSKNKK